MISNHTVSAWTTRFSHYFSQKKHTYSSADISFSNINSYIPILIQSKQWNVCTSLTNASEYAHSDKFNNQKYFTPPTTWSWRTVLENLECPGKPRPNQKYFTENRDKKIQNAMQTICKSMKIDFCRPNSVDLIILVFLDVSCILSQIRFSFLRS